MAASSFHVRLLGEFDLIYRDTQLKRLRSPREQSLFVYLIIHAGSLQDRRHVAFLLWPDLPESHARNNLRQIIHQLRHALPEAERFLAVDAQSIGWRVDADQDIDLIDFRHALAEADVAARCSDTVNEGRWLQAAVAAYQGDLVPACYDDWIAPEREHLRQQCQAACRRLEQMLEMQRDYGAALRLTQRLLRLDPSDETTHVTLMRLHTIVGDVAGARKVYEFAVKTLQRELEAEPGMALVEAFQRLQRTPALASADVRTPQDASRFALVGRHAEWRSLEATWRHAAAGRPHLALIQGEAGIGKSRLASELFEWVARQGFTAAYARSYDAEGRLSLGPVTEWLRSRALRPGLAGLDAVWLSEIARLLPELLSERDDLGQPEPVTELGGRRRFFEALARAATSAPRPLLLWIDDVQWCDQETLDWLHFLLRFDPDCAVLILATARIEESLPNQPASTFVRKLEAEGRLTLLELSPLDAAETAKLAAQVQGSDLDEAAAMSLFRETQGNPLFIVETVHAASNGDPAPDVRASPGTLTSVAPHLPPRVYAVISRRLAQLSPAALKVVQVGAALGRAFALDLLVGSGCGDEETVVQALEELWQRRLVIERDANMWDFAHDRMRDVAYAEIGAPHRRFLHRRIARALEALYHHNLDAVSGEIAAQHERAGAAALAIPYYQRAGAVAASVWANQAAVGLLTRALLLLGEQAAGSARDSVELPLQLALARLYRIEVGWASPQAADAVMRAVALSSSVGNLEQRSQALFGLQTFYEVSAQHRKVEQAYAQYEQLFTESAQEPPPFATMNFAFALVSMGRLVEGRAMFEKLIAARDDQQIQRLQESQGLNYFVHCLAWNAHVLWSLGHVREALAASNAAVDFANDYAQPFNQALAVTYRALLFEWCADLDDFHRRAVEAHTLATGYHAYYYQTWANILVHFAHAWRQTNAEGVAGVRRAIDHFASTGARIRLPVYLSQLARVYQRAGRFDEALEAIGRAQAEADRNEGHWWDVELHRILGEIRWSMGAAPDAIETSFRTAIGIAQAQQAKSLELRATTSLARLLRATGRSDAAAQQLQGIVHWFDARLETGDLAAARALLAQPRTAPH